MRGVLGERLGRQLGRWGITLLLALWAVMALYPIYYTIINSFKTRVGYAKNPFGFPASLNLHNFRDVLSRFTFWRLLLNSMLTTFGGVVLCTIVSLMIAYALTKMRFRGRNYVFLIVIATLLIPNQTIMYPLYQTMFNMKLTNQYYGLILAYGAFGLPLGTYLLAAYFKSVPNELLEAARMDGANHWQILWRVMFPVAMPAVVTLAIINTVWMWNDLLLPLLILSADKRTTLMVAIALLRGQYDVFIPLICAGLVIAMTPVIIAYLFGQRQLIKGMTAGAVK